MGSNVYLSSLNRYNKDENVHRYTVRGVKKEKGRERKRERERKRLLKDSKKYPIYLYTSSITLRYLRSNHYL